MKRGRPNVRQTIQSNLMNILAASQTPLTISNLTRFISKELNKTVSWNTVQKYLQELVEVDKVQMIMLPHSKLENQNGLTLYKLKK